MVLEHTPSREADGGQDMTAAVFGKVLPVIEGIDVSLAHWLPWNPWQRGPSLNHPFDKLL